MNSIFVIGVYKHGGAYVFDDETRQLVKEPFVAGIPEIIRSIVGNAEAFTAYFSETAFPGHQHRLNLHRAESGGHWYRLDDGAMEGWLCPALLTFFDIAPQTIYIELKSAA